MVRASSSALASWRRAPRHALSGRAKHRGRTRFVLGVLELQTLLPLVVIVERTVIGTGLGALDRTTFRIAQWPVLIAVVTASNANAHHKASYQDSHSRSPLVARRTTARLPTGFTLWQGVHP